VVEDRVPKNETVIILLQKMEEQAVTLMDLLMKSQKVVTVELALVYESFYMYKLIVLHLDTQL
jgi:hypothetical protein